MGEFMTFTAKLIAKKEDLKERTMVTEESSNIYTFKREEGFVVVLIADTEYPHRVAHQLVTKVADEFIVKHPKRVWESSDAELPFPELENYIEKYQDPEAADPIMKIQKELDETKIVLHKTIDSVLERGEKIDSLVAKSENLSFQSKAFYSQAKKQNSCCVVM